MVAPATPTPVLVVPVTPAVPPPPPRRSVARSWWLWTMVGVVVAGGVATGLGVGLPYAAVFNGAAASVPRSPASAQAIVGWGGLLTAVVGPPLVGTLLDATGDFTAGFLAFAAIVLAVLALTRLIRPFDMTTVDVASADACGAGVAL